MLEINFLQESFIASCTQTSISIDLVDNIAPIQISIPPKLEIEILSTQQFLPSQLNQSGRFLKTNGSYAYWSIPPSSDGQSSFPESGSLVRNSSGQVMQVNLETKTINITRDDSGKIQQVSDGTYLYNFIRDNEDMITSWVVSEI